MKPNPVHRLPAPLEAAIQRVKLAAREAVERSIESLGLAALAAQNAFQRDVILGAQIELNRKSAVFALTFNEHYDQRVLREISPAPSSDSSPPGKPLPVARALGPATATDWARISLVEDQEVEAQISGDRFGMQIAQSCEWELRELDGYISSLLDQAGGERERNPLRPDLIGHAMIRGITDVSERDDVRKLLSKELSRSLGGLLKAAYADIVSSLRQAGVRPSSLAVRQRQARLASGGAAGDEDSGDPTTATGSLQPGSLQPGSLQPGSLQAGDARRRNAGSGPPGDTESVQGAGPSSARGQAPETERNTRYGERRFGASRFAPTVQGAMPGAGREAQRAPGTGTLLGQVDPALMTLIRRINLDGGEVDSDLQDGGDTEPLLPGGEGGVPGRSRPPRNLIRAHREELRRASSGSLDHMVIDVIGFMFDQILADPKVPSELAHQIARLQLPVLRAALGDKTFFSSRRHPVRRFINRIASLGSAFDDFNEPVAQGFLAKVRALVQEIAEGDFDRIETYEKQLGALEAYCATPHHPAEGPQHEAAALLSLREDQQRLRECYAQRLAGELKDIDAPPFLRDFLATVWSQVLLRAAEPGGPDGPLALQLRSVGRALFLSVQDKAKAADRKAFLAELPQLMRDLTQGMDLIAWPESQRRAFFALLMAAHAQALKAISVRPLEANLVARRIESVLQKPLPSMAELASAPARTAADPLPSLTPEEARRVGLLTESAVDWNARVEARPAADNQPESNGGSLLPGVAGLPVSNDAAVPAEGLALAEHLQVGCAYEMHVDGGWQKVRLSHVSPARSFFIFTHGSKDRKTISLTLRMLLRLCETGRLKAFESSLLVERATARARHQLSGLGGAD